MLDVRASCALAAVLCHIWFCTCTWIFGYVVPTTAGAARSRFVLYICETPSTQELCYLASAPPDHNRGGVSCFVAVLGVCFYTPGRVLFRGSTWVCLADKPGCGFVSLI